METSGIFYGLLAGGIAVFIAFAQCGWWLRLLSVLVLLFGYTSSDYFLRYADGIPDIFAFASTISPNPCRRRRRPRPRDTLTHSNSSSTTSLITATTTATNACAVCGSDHCNRTGGRGSCSSIYAISNSGGGPRIPKVIDDVLEEFFELTLKRYVENWYEALISPEDKAFAKQLRAHIRYALCQCYARTMSVDLSHVILDEILPVAINHATVYADVRRQNADLTPELLEDRVLERMSSTKLLHPAMRSRNSEFAYLKRLVEFLIIRCSDKSLSPTSQTFLRELLTFEVVLPAVDAVADPHVINRILELFFDPLPMRTFDGDLSEKVLLLGRFVDEKNANARSDTVVFQAKLSEILRDPPMLYVFMSYMKSVNAPMNWLQFILSANDIQRQLHSGGQFTREELSHLHWQSWELYRNFLHEGAPDKLGDDVIPSTLANELKTGVESGPEQVITVLAPLLEQAYQIVYHKLQWRYVAPFCQSTKFMEMICSPRHRDEADEEEDIAKIDEKSGGGLLLLERFGDVFDELAHHDVVGASSASGSDEDEAVVMVHKPLNAGGGTSLDEGPITVAPKDLSVWKASIPRIEPRRDPQTGRTMYVYVVEVEASTESGTSRRWCTDRRYREFFVLEGKLVEFHGEQVLGGFPLPPKKTFNNKSRAFIESQRAVFDQFLKRLLHNPALKSSELLHAFVTSANELTASFLPDPFKVMRKMPGKLARERGQNLSSFLQSLVNSVSKSMPGGLGMTNELRPPELMSGRISPNPIGGRSSPFVIPNGSGAAKALQDKLYNSRYKNNFDLMTRSSSVPSGKSDDPNIILGASRPHGEDECVRGVYDSLILLANKIFQISYIPWALFVSARTIVRRTFDSYVSRYLTRQLETAMHEERLVLVVRALMDLVFFDEEEEMGDAFRAKMAERKENALALAKLYFETELGLVRRVVGAESFDGGLQLIFDCLQSPRLNKQLFYLLLDAAVRELFPEVS